jgi:hypothetical protein
MNFWYESHCYTRIENYAKKYSFKQKAAFCLRSALPTFVSAKTGQKI